MHKKNGSVVRRNPCELHTKDLYYYDESYATSSRKRDKYSELVAVFGAPNSMVATVGHGHHCFRRGLLNNFFSKRSVMELMPMIHEKELRVMQRFERAYQDGTGLQLGNAFAAFTADLISQYSWGVSDGFLDDENFNNDFRQIANEVASLPHVYRFFPTLAIIARAMPRWLLSGLKSKAALVLDVQDTVAQQFTPQKKPKEISRKTIFDGLSDPSVPPEERTPPRLGDEGMIVLLAGNETTARVLALAASFIYQNKLLIVKLREKLRPVMPTPATEASWTQLEQLPYLDGDFSVRAKITNVVKE